MRNISKFVALGLAFAVMIASPVFAEDKAKPFTDAKEVNLLDLLPPPPANDSAKTKAEIGEVLAIQVTRTPEMVDRAVADAEEDIWRYSDVIGNPKFTKENLPKFSAFFDRIVETEAAVVDPAKDVWKRTRPHLLYPDLIKPVVPLSKSGSYPSGHTTVGTLMGVVLSDMVPEKKDAIMARAWEYGWNRVVGGIHYPTDIEAGRISGIAIAQTIMQHDDYKAEYEAAKSELRSALGL
ncbi:acid phosphatase [Rhizobium sp. CF142]|uniref:acid phosphatase n=1 Tax=Rhizobium sp. CF142 TaxID=1144314 RepID=UPI00026EFED0|nr:phosphatase PAP2 family protein [Rhizobium sp. CF142]EJJ29298.1 membrane-associated phospholipid phosphatase [Rhizobium sp. CF142]